MRTGGALALFAVVVIVGVVACREMARGGRAGRARAEGNLSNLFHMGIDGGKAVHSKFTGKAFVLIAGPTSKSPLLRMLSPD